jgi:periplasmic protein TonB
MRDPAARAALWRRLPRRWRPLWRRMAKLSTLHWALLASFAVHGALLVVRIVDPEAFNRATHRSK